MSKQIVQIFEAFSEKLNFMWLNDQNHNDLMIFDIENWFLKSDLCNFWVSEIKNTKNWFFSKKILPVDPCPQNSTTEVTLLYKHVLT